MVKTFRHLIPASVGISLLFTVVYGCKRPSLNPSSQRTTFLKSPEELDTECQLALADEIAGTISARPQTDIRKYSLKQNDFKLKPIVYSGGDPASYSYGLQINYEPTMDYDHLAWKVCDSLVPKNCASGRFVGSTEITNLPGTTVNLELSACVDLDRAVPQSLPKEPDSPEVCGDRPLVMNAIVLSTNSKQKPQALEALARNQKLRFESLITLARAFKAELAKSITYHATHPGTPYLDALTLKSSQNMLQAYSVYYTALLFSQEALLLPGYFGGLAQLAVQGAKKSASAEGLGLSEGTQGKCTSRLSGGGSGPVITSPLSQEVMDQILADARAKNPPVDTLGIPDGSSTTPTLTNGTSTAPDTGITPEDGHTIAYSKPFLTWLGVGGIVGGGALLYYSVAQRLIPPEVSAFAPWAWIDGFKNHEVLEKVKPEVKAYNTAMAELGSGFTKERVVKAQVALQGLKSAVLGGKDAPEKLKTQLDEMDTKFTEIQNNIPTDGKLTEANKTRLGEIKPEFKTDVGPLRFKNIIGGFLGAFAFTAGVYSAYESARKPEGSNLVESYPEASGYYQTMMHIEREITLVGRELEFIRKEISSLSRSP